MTQWLRPGEAAERLGISYPTLKQWIYQGKLRSVKTAGGHHRVSRAEVDRVSRGAPVADAAAERAAFEGPGLGAGLEGSGFAGKESAGGHVSGRNKLSGRITEVRLDGLLAQVVIDLGAQSVTSIITRAAAEEMELRPGIEATALVKATEVMIIRE
jgi:molybdopterin-binding protein